MINVRYLTASPHFFCLVCWSSTNYPHLVGKTLAFTNIKFTNLDGHVVARGSHTKSVLYPIFESKLLMSHRYVAQAWKDPNNIVEEMNKHKDQ